MLKSKDACGAQIATDEVECAFAYADAVRYLLAELLERARVTLCDGEFELDTKSALGVGVTGVDRVLDDVTRLLFYLELGQRMLPGKDIDGLAAEIESGVELVLKISMLS